MARAALLSSSRWRKAAVALGLMASPHLFPALPAAAQTVAATPEIVITAPKPSHACDAADGGTAPVLNYACLTQALQAKAGVTPPDAVARPATDLASPGDTGTFSYSATKQRMGDQFGVSATPQRPPAPVYAPPAAAPARPVTTRPPA